MFQVIKRDGSKADFTLTKINDAIMKAFTATQMSYNNDIIDLLALRVTADFQKKVENDEIHVEDIQDSVERVLGQAGYEEVAKAYILYRKQREKMRAMKSTILDYKDVVNSYVKVEDSTFTWKSMVAIWLKGTNTKFCCVDGSSGRRTDSPFTTSLCIPSTPL